MRITEVTLKNFKGVRETVKIPLAPITMLFGINSVGKSTILHALVYLYEVIVNRNYDADMTWLAGDSLNLGGFRNLVHGKQESEPITLGLELDVRDEILPAYITEGEDWLFERESVSGLEAPVFSPKTVAFQITLAWSHTLRAPYCRRLTLFADGELTASLETRAGQGKVSIEFINTKHSGLAYQSLDDRTMGEYLVSCLEKSVDSEDNLLDIPLIGLTDALPALGKMIDLDYFAWSLDGSENALVEQLAVRSLLSQMIVAPLDKARTILAKLAYLGPLRDVPPRNFAPLLGLIPARWVDGSAAWDLLGNSDNEVLRKSVNQWLSNADKLASSYEVAIERNEEVFSHSIFLRPSDSDIRLSLSEVGVGLSQVIPVITAALHAQGGLVAIEQPELHIHPAWQLILGELFLQSAKSDGTSFLLESHSEHLMLRILRRLREANDINTEMEFVDKDASLNVEEQGVSFSFEFIDRGDSDSDMKFEEPYISNDLGRGSFRTSPHLVEANDSEYGLNSGEEDVAKDADPLRVSPEDICILYVDQIQGETKFCLIRVDEEGEFLDRWPRGFFNERRGEMM